MVHVIGYHYTSWEHWQKIQREGLKPYPLVGSQFGGESGIWTFDRRQTRARLRGQVFWVMCRHDTDAVAELAVEYEPADAYPWTVTHSGDFTLDKHGTRTVWHKREPATILRTFIPRTRVRLLNRWEIKAA